MDDGQSPKNQFYRVIFGSLGGVGKEAVEDLSTGL
jgi:hypothetical protein